MQKFLMKLFKKMGESGGTIYIPTGDFYIDTPIEIDRSYVSVVGENSGLRSGVDSGNNKSQSGGGGSRLIARPNVTVFRIEDKDNQDRISGLTFSSFQIYGQSNNGIGIEGVQDTDRVVVDEVVINNVGIGIKLNGADAFSLKNSWISETASSVILSGASQQANISNNALGAQPGGSTVELENPQWFNISNNNIYPDGSSNIRLFNPFQGTISGNTISSRYNGVIEVLPNDIGEIGNDNLISGNIISVVEAKTHPEGKNKEWGIIHLEANNTHINGNQIIAQRMPEEYSGIWIKDGENNRISNNSLAINQPTSKKIVLGEMTRNTIITDSIFDNELLDNGLNNINEALPNKSN